MQFWANAKEKGAKKGRKKANVNAPVFSPFSSLFGSLYPFHAVWVLLWFSKGQIAPQVFKRLGEFFWIL
jgi:hypothetical protein